MKLKSFLKNYTTIFFDCDGVLWEDTHLLPYAKEVIESLRENEKRIFFISNNSTKSIAGYLKKFLSFDLQVFPEEIILSSKATLYYLQSQKNIRNVYIVGEEGLVSTIKEGKFNVYHDDISNELVDQIDTVIVGMDRTLDYRVLTIAIRAILNGARFVGTNPDPTFPEKDGISPGAGCMLGAIKGSINKEPEVICGKPDPFMANLLLDDPKYNLRRDEVVMIGDRVSTDMEFARRANIDGILVKTGFGKEELIKNPNFPFVKVLDGVSDLLIL